MTRSWLEAARGRASARCLLAGWLVLATCGAVLGSAVLGSAVLGSAVLASAVLGSGCATYRDDLDRSVQHYNARSYDKALALLEVLEPDIDSLSEAERAQYAYYRGMSHFLLEQRLHARHWLGRAAAREKGNEGSLNPEEKKKVGETLGELNKDRYGGSDVPGPERTKCNVDLDCVKGQFCENSLCTKAPSGDAKDGDTKDGDTKKKGDDAKSRGKSKGDDE